MSGRYIRTPIPEENREERQTTFGGILRPYSREEAVLEAQRCLQCAMPFCVQACPITQDCRGYIRLIGEEKFDEAAHLTVRDNPLATVLCKTCYHYCEEDCVMGERGVPIAIRHLKRAALEFGASVEAYRPSAPKHERVAIVGAGPAGLAAAWDLALRGYSVTVFESEEYVGGEIESIPKYHLDGTELSTDLARFSQLDITFRMGRKAGRDFTPEGLLGEGYLAVYVAIGTVDPRRLGLDGEALPGVFLALPFLIATNTGPQGLLGRMGRRVVVIGGGDVAMDAARSSLRLSRKGEVTVIYRRKREEMPAGEEELRGAEEEGVRFLFERTPVRIVGEGHVEGVVVQSVSTGPLDDKGKPTQVVVPGSETTVACDTIIEAVGERADLAGLPTELNLATRVPGGPEGRGDDWMTDVEGIFAGGGRSIVYAMGAGAKVAQAIDAYLARKRGRPPTPRPGPLDGGSPPPLPDGYGGPTWHL